MTGEEKFLTEKVTKHVYRPLRKVVQESSEMVLSHQFVESGFNPCMLFKVKTGSGQGLIHSGAISNAAFLQHAELNGACLARSHFQQSAGILMYVRYVDNLLFFLEDANRLEPLLQHLRSHLSPYTGKIEEYSDSSVTFLDLQLNVHRGSVQASVGCAPVLRTTGPILNWMSGHPTGIHVNWPLAFIKTLWTHSSTLHEYECARAQFFHRLRSSAVDEGFITYLCSSTQYIQPCSFQSRESSGRDSASVLRLVLEFHPLLERANLGALLRSHTADPFHRDLFSAVFGNDVMLNTGIAWKLTSKPFASQLVAW